MNKYEILEITPDELPKCSSFWNINDTRLIERKVFAYKIDDEYVGGCALFVRYEKCGHFSHFDVRSDLRGNGIGSRILEFAIQYFKDIGMEKMRLHVLKDNKSAIRLYKKYAFEYVEDITPEKIVMIKIL
ncbi:MAG: GNAT family N-acetyltransferase [Oscillospiraceae bacterium]|nr:GNAT family N-acetyltransferase [Oscillospiraceae bacterium]MDD4414765.1 GNAT family N-acetyltransferase [Oscillospiraceae bacterium]